MEFLFAYACLAFLALFAVGMGFFIVAADRRHARLARTWSAYAARRGFAYHEGPSLERPFRIEGRRDGVAFALETEKSTRTGAVVTRLLGRPRAPVRGPVVAALGACRTAPEHTARVATDDAHFDHLFEVRAKEQADVRAVLTPAVRLALQRFPTTMFGEGLRLAVEDDEVEVAWPGDEINHAQLDAAHAILAQACAAQG
jgi:hypothetical protein